jgi:hypothetical protein
MYAKNIWLETDCLGRNVLGTEYQRTECAGDGLSEAEDYAMCADRKYVKRRIFFFSQDLVWREPQPLCERGRSTLRLGGWKEGHQTAVSGETFLFISKTLLYCWRRNSVHAKKEFLMLER